MLAVGLVPAYVSVALRAVRNDQPERPFALVSGGLAVTGRERPDLFDYLFALACIAPLILLTWERLA